MQGPPIPHAGVAPTRGQWIHGKPLLPGILELVNANPGTVGEVALRLSEELGILYAKLDAHPQFAPPPSAASVLRIVPTTQAATRETQPATRDGRAVSLPPSLPDHGHMSTNGSGDANAGQDYRMRRPLGDGIPQYQPYWCVPHSYKGLIASSQCAIDQRVPSDASGPASRTHFNQHPKKVCREDHPLAVKWRVGCNFHRGILDGNAICRWCNSEREEGKYHLSLPINETEGYPGDDFA
jgi:hypothetical protein